MLLGLTKIEILWIVGFLVVEQVLIWVIFWFARKKKKLNSSNNSEVARTIRKKITKKDFEKSVRNDYNHQP